MSEQSIPRGIPVRMYFGASATATAHSRSDSMFKNLSSVPVRTEMADPRGSANEPRMVTRPENQVLSTRLQRKVDAWLMVNKVVIGTYANMASLIVYIRKHGGKENTDRLSYFPPI
jgi:hypothetical protein